MKNIHIYIFLFIATFLLGIFWQPWLDSILRPLTQASTPIFFIAIALIFIFLIYFSVLFLSDAKSVILKSLAEEQRFTAIDFYEFSDLDRENLALYTHSLESLGFNCLGDYKLTHASTEGMTRMFAHPQYYCFAGILQTFFEQRYIPMFYSIESAFEQGWSLSHRNYNMSGFLGGISYMMRQKRHL